MNYKSITLEQVQEWLENNDSTSMPLEAILWQLVVGETNINELRTWIIQNK